MSGGAARRGPSAPAGTAWRRRTGGRRAPPRARRRRNRGRPRVARRWRAARAGRVQPEVAVIALDRVVAAVDRGEARAGLERSVPDCSTRAQVSGAITGSAADGSSSACAGAGTPHTAPAYRAARAGSRRRCRGTGCALACDADRIERPVGVGVRAARHAPDAVEDLELAGTSPVSVEVCSHALSSGSPEAPAARSSASGIPWCATTAGSWSPISAMRAGAREVVHADRIYSVISM